MPKTPFDILRRHLDGSFLWMEAASSLDTAQVRMLELHAHAPGDYFVFDQSQQIVANSKGVTGNAI